MDNFKKKFIEEATDLIDGLEKSLLELEENPEDQTIVQQVFRVMHTLKGNSGMFGYHMIDSFTHEMETIYDLIRNGKLQVTREILDLTLTAVDHLKILLDDSNYDDPLVIENHENLLSKVSKLIQSDSVGVAAESVENDKNKINGNGSQNDGATYYILFDPQPKIFSNGTNPLFLLDELHSIGEVKVFAHLNRVPSLKDINPDLCYVYWEAIIATEASVNDISDVFIFVEDEATIEIQKIADGNLLSDEFFLLEVDNLAAIQKDIGLNTIQKLSQESVSRRVKSKATTSGRDKAASKETTISSIRVSSDKLDILMNLVSELVTTQARLSLFAEENSVPGLMPIAENVQKLSRQLRDVAFSIVLIPIENMLTRFQRLVRDLSAELGKEVVFTTEGAETELDKTIIEKIGRASCRERL